MQKRIRKCTVTVFAILLIIVFSACSQEEANESNEKDDEPKPSTEQPSPTEGGTLTVGVMDEVRIDPVGFDKTRSEYTAAEQLVYQGLFSYSADQQLKPQLIEEYQYKVAEEEKQLVLTLKKGISWHDGKPVTTDDIVYTLQTYLHPYYYGIWGDDLDVISGVSNYRSFRDETISGVSVDREKNQVLIRLDRYDLSFLHALTAPLLPKHQLEEKSFSEIERLSAEGKLLGTGPFRLDGMEEGSVRFQRFDDYYVQTPYLEEIVMLEVNPSLSFEEWSQKGIDLMKVGPLDEKQLPESYRLETVSGPGFQYVGLNHDREPLNNKEIRTALHQGLSKEELIKNVYHGFAEPLHTLISPVSWAAKEERRESDFDRAAAKAALENRGYGGSNPLTLSLLYMKDNPLWERIARELQRQWADVHIELETEAVSGDVFLQRVFGGEPYDLYLHGWSFDRNLTHMLEMWHGHEQAGELGFNALNYANETADQALEAALTATSFAEQKNKLNQWEPLFMEGKPLIPLAVPQELYVIHERVRDVNINGYQPFAKIEEWWVASEVE